MKLNYDMALLLQDFDDIYKCSFMEGLENQNCMNGACMRFRSIEQCVCKDLFWGPNCNYSVYESKGSDSSQDASEKKNLISSISTSLQQYWTTAITVFVLIAFLMFFVGLALGKNKTGGGGNQVNKQGLLRRSGDKNKVIRDASLLDSLVMKRPVTSVDSCDTKTM